MVHADLSAINAEVDSAVRSLFTVTDYFVGEAGAGEYSVAYDASSQPNFLKLLERLEPADYSAMLYGDKEHATLSVIKNPPPEKGQQAVRLSGPLFLFFLAVLSILVTGYLISLVYPTVSPGGSSSEMTAGFVGVLVGMLSLKYLAQRRMARLGRFSFVSYYLPNVPLFIALPTLYFLPTFGGVSFASSPPANKDKLFDFYIVGALAMVVVAALVALFSAGTSVVLTHSQYQAITSGNSTSTIQTNPSLIQAGVISLAQSIGFAGQVPAGGTLIFSPVEIAAWVGLLLAFINLVPAALFDGGRMAILAIGRRGARVTTVVAGVLLLLADPPDYWVVFLLVFLMAAFPVQGETLDSISGLSRSRKAVFWVAVVLGLLCVPIPQTFANLPL